MSIWHWAFDALNIASVIWLVVRNHQLKQVTRVRNTKS